MEDTEDALEVDADDFSAGAAVVVRAGLGKAADVCVVDEFSEGIARLCYNLRSCNMQF